MICYEIWDVFISGGGLGIFESVSAPLFRGMFFLLFRSVLLFLDGTVAPRLVYGIFRFFFDSDGSHVRLHFATA